MVILRATSILGGQKEDKRMMCSISLERKREPGEKIELGMLHFKENGVWLTSG
jgi:hypothetical protein